MDGDEEVTDLSCRSLKALPRSLLSAGPKHSILELNLAFNELVSLDGVVEACPQLQRLAAAHNKIRTLPRLHALPHLCRVDLSSNQLKAISPLESCASLTELWLANNLIDLAALQPLRSAVGLRTLVLTKNPCVRVHPSGMYLHTVLLVLPQLTSLDAQPVERTARSDALVFLQRQQPRAALAEAVGTKEALSLLRGVAPPSEAQLGAPSGGSSTSSRSHLQRPPRRHPTGRRQAGGRGGGASGGLRHAEDDALSSCSSPSAGHVSPCGTRGESEAWRQAACGSPDPGWTECGETSETASDCSPTRSRRHGARAAGRSAHAVEAEAAREATLLSAQQRLAESERMLSETRAATSAAPRHVPRCGRRAHNGAAGIARPLRAAPSTVPSSEGDFTIPYPSGAVAVLVRSDGTAICRWPGGAVAATVDRAEGALGFELRANFRRGSLAAAFDASGKGFASRRDGSALLRREVRRGELTTTLHDERGAETERWMGTVDDAAAAAAAAAAMAGEPAAPLPARHAAAPLDLQLALLIGRNGGLAIAFCAEGVRHTIVHGVNPQQPVWDAGDDFLDEWSRREEAARSPKRVVAQTKLPATCGPGGVSAGLAGIADALALLPTFDARR